MTLDIVRKSIKKERDGTISLAIAVIEIEGGNQIGSMDVQGYTPQEIESKLRPKLQKLITTYNAQKDLELEADDRINILKSEFGIGGTV